LDSTIVRPEVEAAGESEPSGLAGLFQMETQVEGQMLTPQPDMETSTSPSAVALPGSGIIHLDYSASAAAIAAGGALPPTAEGTQQQTPHIHHASTSRQAPALEMPVAEGLTQVCTSLQTDNHASTPPLSFYRPDALPTTQPTASKH